MNGAGVTHEVKSVAGPSTWPSKLRKCRGNCGKHRSHTQFAAGSDVCIRCAQLGPQVAKRKVDTEAITKALNERLWVWA